MGTGVRNHRTLLVLLSGLLSTGCINHKLSVEVDSNLKPLSVEAEDSKGSPGVTNELHAKPGAKIRWRLNTGDDLEKRFQICVRTDGDPIEPDAAPGACYGTAGTGDHRRVVLRVSENALGPRETSRSYKYDVEVICSDGTYGTCNRDLDPVIIVER
jgi:hypothetical protein